jgi:hypothetical protein
MGVEPHVPNELSKLARQILDEGHDSWKDFLEPPDFGQRYQHSEASKIEGAEDYEAPLER